MKQKPLPDPVELLRRLIQFDTSNPPGNEEAALRYIQQQLLSYKVDSVFLETAKSRGNLVSLIPCNCTLEEKQCNLVLLSHIDVVGADPTQWLEPPFAANIRDGYIYGRGTVDTKQLTAMEIGAFLSVAQSSEKRNRDTWLVVTSDEEAGSEKGLVALLDSTLELGGKTYCGQDIFAGSGVISEGGGFPIIVNNKTVYLCEAGQKGVANCTLTALSHNQKGPFLPSTDGTLRAMSAVADLAKLSFKTKVLPSVASFIASMCEISGVTSKGDADLDIIAVSDFLPVFMSNILKAMTRDTIAVTMLQGQGLSTTKILLDCRLLPGSTQAQLEAIIQPICEKYGLSLSVDNFSAGYESGASSVLFEQLCLSTEHVVGQGVPVLPFFTVGSSDGRHIAPLDAAVYGYSPTYSWDMPFDSAVQTIHNANERIHTDSVMLGSEILAHAALVFVTTDIRKAEFK